jgi:hypothetical protein
LRELTADDLKELGVTLVGHRRKLLAAIAALRTEPPTRDVAQSGASAPSARLRNEASHPAIDAERRQLTVNVLRPGRLEGGAAAAGVPIIVWYKACQHQIEPDPAELAERYGAEARRRVAC